MKKAWQVTGLKQELSTFKILRRTFRVYYTSDETAKVLSIADEKGDVMFSIPFDKIFDDIKEDNGQ